MASVVANHYMAAYHASPEGGEADALAAKATAALRKAAQRAADLHSSRQVLDICEEALDLGARGSTQAELLELAAVAATALLEEETGIDYAKRAVAWQEEHGDEAGRVRTATLLGQTYLDFYHPAHATEVLESVFAAHPDLNTPEELRLGSALVRAHMLSGNDASAIEVSEQVLIPAEAQEDAAVIIETLNTRGTSLANLGRNQEGLALVKRALELAEQHDLPLSALRAHNNIGVLTGTDDQVANMENATAAYEKAQLLGDPGYLVRTTVSYANVLLESGRFEEAERAIADIEIGDDSPFGRWLGWQLARINAARGEPDAGEKARQTVALMRQHEDEPQAMFLNDSVAAFAESMAGDFEAAYDAAMAARHPFGMPWDLMAAAEAAIMLGDADRLRRVEEKLQERAVRGRRFTTLKLLVAGAIEVLDGDRDTGVAHLREFRQLQAKVELGLSRADGDGKVAMLLGPDDPVGKEAAEALLAFCREFGTPGLCDRYAAALPSEDIADAAG